jgi:hypothetical protein
MPFTIISTVLPSVARPLFTTPSLCFHTSNTLLASYLSVVVHLNHRRLPSDESNPSSNTHQTLIISRAARLTGRPPASSCCVYAHLSHPTQVEIYQSISFMFPVSSQPFYAYFPHKFLPFCLRARSGKIHVLG